MNLVTLENITKQFSERVLLEEASLLINSGDRIGLIGPNGSGKTTLLRIIAGLEPTDQGNFTVWGGVTVRYLPQEPELADDMSILEQIFQSNTPHIRLLRNYEEVSQQLRVDSGNQALQEELARLTSEMDQTGGWAAEASAKTVLTKLGVSHFEATIGTLSGGQRKRVALAQALIAPADLLILDEPTNHIDAGAVAWLEAYLLKRPGALLMVTHDRYFLERIANRIVELDRRQLVNYSGNYRRYLEQREQKHQQLAATERKQQNLLRQELEWLRRGAMARGTKQKARKQRIEELQQISHDLGDRRVAMVLASRRLGKRVLEAGRLSKAYGSLRLFSELDFNLDPGDRIGIIGPNGAGKSTFLDILAGKTKPDSGTIQWGETVELAYYDQQSVGLQDELRVNQFIEMQAPLIQTPDGGRIEAAQMLEWFLFSRREQQSKIGSLSGGERRRLYLLSALVHQPNVLFLDEPTNDLDIQTLTVLEQFLDHFAGCLVVVSHDRYFLDRNVDYLMSFEEGVLGTRFPTPFEAYQRWREHIAPTPSRPPKPAARTPQPRARPRKLTWKEQRELESLEGEIGQLTEKILELESSVNSVGADYVRLQLLAEELQQTRASLISAEERWLDLSEIADAG